jgi:preprotein translocase subunit SecD
MLTHDSRFFAATAMASLLCAASAACTLPGPLWTRDAGGVYMILAVKAEPATAEQNVSQAAQVIQTRCDHLGVQCKVERQGGEESNRLKLSVSGARDFGRIKAVLLAEGRLELRPVVSPPSPNPMQTYPTREAAEKAAGQNYDVFPYEEAGEPSGFLTVEREPVVSGADLRDASAAPATTGFDGDDYMIGFTLRPEGAVRFGEWTGANTGRYLAIILNGRVRSVPYIKGPISDSGQISGNFTKEQAQDIALTLRSGNLPAPIEVLEEGPYGR